MCKLLHHFRKTVARHRSGTGHRTGKGRYSKSANTYRINQTWKQKKQKKNNKKKTTKKPKQQRTNSHTETNTCLRNSELCKCIVAECRSLWVHCKSALYQSLYFHQRLKKESSDQIVYTMLRQIKKSST